MPEGSRSRQIASYALLRVFANDDTIDAEEMAVLRRLALEDEALDEQERAVLGRIFARVRAEQVSPEVWQQICDFRRRYGVD